MIDRNMLLKIKTVLILLILGLVLSSSTESENGAVMAPSGPRVKNIILIIGDGMGIVQVSAAMTISKYNLNMTTARHIGFMRTQSYDNYLTDSGASGTAMSSGVKTRNGMIGMAPDSTDVKLITELIREKKKMSYGVVCTSAVTHATPASFVAHNVDRNDYEGIALDFIRNQPDVFFGGGKDHFYKREDKRDLLSILQKYEYELVYTLEDVLKAQGQKVAGLLADVHLPRYSDGRGIMLADFTQKAIQLLSRNRKGFFLMVEGSQIDWGGHDNDPQYVLEETYDLDIAIGEALKFAAEDKHTLVIVTADHETGGMTLIGGSEKDFSIIAKFSSGGHTGVVVPVFAFGPGAEEFTGFYQNTDLYEKFKKVLRIQ